MSAYGGEDICYESEVEILRRNGNEVIVYYRNNNEICGKSTFSKIKLYYCSSWSRDTYNDVLKIIKRDKPDVLYVHNTWFCITPSILAAAKDMGVPVVARLHNYRLICLDGSLRMGASSCEKCVGTAPLYGVYHRCYKKSYSASYMLYRYVITAQKDNYFNESVAAVIVLTKKMSDIYARSGLVESNKIKVLPPFIQDKANISPYYQGMQGACFVGQLTEQKGVHILIKAWLKLRAHEKLLIVGCGPQESILKDLAEGAGNIHFTGMVGNDKVLEYMQSSKYVVVPSLGNEGFGMVVTEAFKCGRAVLANDSGSLNHIVAHGKNGIVCDIMDENEFIASLRTLLDEKKAIEMGKNAREEYEMKYNPKKQYAQLISVLKEASGMAGSGIYD